MTDLDHLRSWTGKERIVEDVISPRLAASLTAIFDDTSSCDPGEPAPLGIHWCLCPDIVPMSGLGADGHPARGTFIPPVALPRRMWAGGHLTIHGNFLIGDVVSRWTRIEAIDVKKGRTGELCFVTLAHHYAVGGRAIIDERQDIVFREAGAPASPVVRLENADHMRQRVAMTTRSILLQRYSSLTCNGHRIHYDRDYARYEEGYAGLVVHGPLQATALLRLAAQARDGYALATFAFRGQHPLIEGSDLLLWENGVPDGAMVATDGDRVVTMRAEAAWR